MKKAHATEGVLGGHALYGVRSCKVMSPQMRTVLESCAVAAKSGDARDKYFAVALGSFDPAAGEQLRSSLQKSCLRPMLAKRRAWRGFQQKGQVSRGFFPAGFLAQQNLLNKRLCLMRLSRRFCLPDTSCKNKFVEMSAGFLVLVPGGTTQANFLS